jgi:hypothetical protein
MAAASLMFAPGAVVPPSYAADSMKLVDDVKTSGLPANIVLADANDVDAAEAPALKVLRNL